jgi:hypothetical protein
MEKLVIEALSDATEEILDLFKKSYLKRYVYDSHGKNVSYHDGSGKPTYEFLESWEWSQIKKATNSLVTELGYHPEKMSFDMDTFLHGSRYSSPNDVRENFPAVLEGKQSSLWLSVNRPIKFWQQFIADLFSGGKLDQIITKHFVSRGFQKV